MKLIGKDLWFVQRQLWIDSLQTKGSASEIKSLVLWVVLGMLFTVILMVW